MRNRLPGIALLLAFVLLAPAFAADDKKPTGKDDKTKHVDSDTLPNASYTGKLLDVPASDGTFTAQVDFTSADPKDAKNPNAGNQDVQKVLQEQAKVTQLEQAVANAKTAKEQQQKTQQLDKALAELQQAMKKAGGDVKLVTDHKTVDFQLSPDVKFRVMQLPVRYDDDGKIMPYTDDEKAKLKGDDKNLPGYQAKPSDLQTGDVVRIRLWRKPEPKKTDSPSDSDKDKDKDKDKTTTEKKSQVTLILVLNEDKTDADKSKDKKSPPKSK